MSATHKYTQEAREPGSFQKIIDEMYSQTKYMLQQGFSKWSIGPSKVLMNNQGVDE